MELKGDKTEEVLRKAFRQGLGKIQGKKEVTTDCAVLWYHFLTQMFLQSFCQIRRHTFYGR